MSTTTLRRSLIALALLALIYVVMVRIPQPAELTHIKDEPKKQEHPRKTTPRKPASARVATPGRRALIETTKGNITIVLYEKDARVTTRNFISLVNRKFYDGLVFHRVVPGFVVQTGDPQGTGYGGSGKTIPLEASPILKHDTTGTLGMARNPDDPNSASSQFYITLAPTPHLDGRHAVFGRVLKGMDIVKKIKVGDKMKKVYLLSTQ